MFESSKIRIASGSANCCRHNDLRNAPMTAEANFGTVNRVCARSAKLQVMEVQGVSPTREKRPIPKISNAQRHTYFGTVRKNHRSIIAPTGYSPKAHEARRMSHLFNLAKSRGTTRLSVVFVTFQPVPMAEDEPPSLLHPPPE